MFTGKKSLKTEYPGRYRRSLKYWIESIYLILQLMENSFRHPRGSVHFHHFVACIPLLTAIVEPITTERREEKEGKKGKNNFFIFSK